MGEGVGKAVVEGGDQNQVGSIRRFDYYGAESQQRLTAYDGESRSMSWESVEPFDDTLSHYEATVQILPITVSDECLAIWSVVFEASENSLSHWREHQQREFRKSLERLSLNTGWALRGDLN